MVPGLPSVAELSALGIARVSTGSRPILTAYSAIDAAARELLATGTYPAPASGALGYPVRSRAHLIDQGWPRLCAVTPR